MNRLKTLAAAVSAASKKGARGALGRPMLSRASSASVGVLIPKTRLSKDCPSAALTGLCRAAISALQKCLTGRDPRPIESVRASLALSA